MSYQVIARKYRPQRFGDVVGQEHVTQTLEHAIEQKRIAHAYLFCGPRGTGKTTIARIFAKCLNCTGGPKVDFDEQDPRCREIAEGRSLDVLEIDGASNNGVEQVRELRDTCRYAPASSRFKIYIIDEVHMLSTAAFNALLKTLEEPPEHVKFMFATTDPEKVLPTILSRCQRYDLRRIPADQIASHLSSVAKQEGVTIEPAALFAIARGAEGAMRDAESTLDQLISFCGQTIQEADVLSMFGLTAQAQLLELAGAVLTGQIESALRQFHDLANHGKDLVRLVSDLLNYFRNLLIFKVSGGDLRLLEVSEGEAASLKEQATMVDAPALSRIMEVFAEAEMRLRDAISKKILIEVTLLKAIEARNALSLDSVLEQLRKLREGSEREVVSIPPTGAVSTAPSTRPFHVEVSRPSSDASGFEPPSLRQPGGSPRAGACTVAAPDALPAGGTYTNRAAESTALKPESLHEASSGQAESSGDQLVVLWRELLEAVSRASPFASSYLQEAHPVSFARNLFTIGFDPEFEDHLSLFDVPRNHALLQTKLAELGHPNSQFKFIKAEPPAGWQRPAAHSSPAAPAPSVSTSPKAAAKEKPAPVAFSKDDFKNDPLIQKALEVFKGQIVEVRA